VDDAPPRGGYDRFTNSGDRYSSSAVADRQEGYDGREIGRREGLPATLEERKNSNADNYGIRCGRDERSSYSNNPPLTNGFGNNDRSRFVPVARNESFSSAGGGDSYGTRYEGGGIDNHQNNNKDYTTFASESKNSGQQSYNSGGNTTTSSNQKSKNNGRQSNISGGNTTKSSNQTTNFGNNLPVASSRPAPPEVYATESRAHPPAAPAVAVVKNLPVASPAPPKAYTNERPVAEAPPPAPLPVLPVKKTDPFNFVNQYNPPYRQTPTPSLPSTSTALPSNNGTASTTATSAKQPTTTTDKPADNQEDDDFWD
uniref:Uncharacterized protein n=1 Tax=Panagrolaimus sp. ES5 TaxID=591445 RepID=A0AC34GDI7_9BILA